MRRILLRVAIFALTFCLGVGVWIGWQVYKWSLPPEQFSDEVVCSDEVNSDEVGPGIGEVVAPGITIVGGMDACGPTANFHSLELSDGTRILQSCETFSSRAAAARELKKRVGDAAVAERSQQRDAKGKLTGEIVLTTSPRVSRLSVMGKSLCITDAPSLNHLRLYETGGLHRR